VFSAYFSKDEISLSIKDSFLEADNNGNEHINHNNDNNMRNNDENNYINNRYISNNNVNNDINHNDDEVNVTTTD
jgi:hypothetical protein